MRALRAVAIALAIGCWHGQVFAAEPAPSSAPDLAMQEAVVLGRKGDWAGAVKALDQAIKLAPEWSDAFYLRGAAYVQLAGPAVNEDAVTQPRLGTSYKEGLKFLILAISDFREYQRLEPDSDHRNEVKALIAEYSKRREATAVAQTAVESKVAETKGSATQYRVIAWTGVGLGVAAAGAGVVWQMVASNQKSGISSGGFATHGDIDAAASAVRTNQGLSYASFALAGALLTTGVIMLLSAPSPTLPDGTRATGLRLERGVVVW